MKQPAPNYEPTARRRVTPEYYARFEEAVISQTGMDSRHAQRLVNGVLSVARLARPDDDDRDAYAPQALARISEDRYARMEAAVVNRAAVDTATARTVLGGILGPLMIAPPLPAPLDHDPDAWSCPHIHYGFDGQFVACAEDRDGHELTAPTHLSYAPHMIWQTGDRRDMNTEAFQW